MNRFSRRLSWLVALGIILGLAILLRSVSNRHRELHDELARAKNEATHLTEKLGRVRERDQQLAPQAANAPSLSPKERREHDLLAQIDHVVPAPPLGPRMPNPSGPYGDDGGEVRDTPEYNENARAIFRKSVQSRYGPWLQSIASPDVRTKAEKLLIDEYFIETDVEETAVRSGLDLEKDRSQLWRLRWKLVADSRSELRTLIGEDEYPRFVAYDTTLPARESIAPVILRLSYSAEPLTPQQIDRIVTLMPQQNSGPPPKMDAALAGAKAVFSPRQWEEVQEFTREGGALRR